MDGAFPNRRGPNEPFPQQQGEGGGPEGGPKPRGFRGTAENAKTKVCTRWLMGDCRFGARCNFAHGDTELRKLPDRPGGRGAGRGGFGQFPGSGRGGYGGRGPGGFQGPGYEAVGYEAVGYGQPQGGPSEDVWAAQGFPVQGPNGWVMYRTRDTGEPYYHNHHNNETSWDRPGDWPIGAPTL
ncbi:Zinc finger CCCH domain-containing protein 52 [Tetrabaena socialis]|uniref:Zinc finger CCCH domain-containing protein 52 n=1 Tax=Tetrabaena socialis TaxID=47790 RepID=A0A2J8ADG4_9CHLO|nr:Zinc finger CCCH domain-containing protein 52 [Tetrabaena socialis]|eukprot:PNH10560.1 Zinc finger CCCH domain-containing protein 52 [Tetrabaena socialis]